MSFAFPLLDTVKSILSDTMPGTPPEIWWLAGCVLFVLALTALVDAFTSVIPDIFIFLGLGAVTATLGMTVSWEIAALHLRHALLAGFTIWVINFFWYKKFHHDALGMGDAKWTMLAVACFGFLPGLFAWGVGAILAVFFMGLMYLAHYKITRVTFAPFLFIGLSAGLYWIRFGN